jgi:hypothetical protein
LLEQTESQEGIQILHLREKEKGLSSLRSKFHRSSEEVELCVKRLYRGTEVAESLEDSKDKLRRSSDFGAQSHSCKECISERTLW